MLLFRLTALCGQDGDVVASNGLSVQRSGCCDHTWTAVNVEVLLHIRLPVYEVPAHAHMILLTPALLFTLNRRIDIHTWQGCWWHQGHELKLIPHQFPLQQPQRSPSDWQTRRRPEARPRSPPADELLLHHWTDLSTGSECLRDDWMPRYATCSLSWSQSPESGRRRTGLMWWSLCFFSEHEA